MALGRPFFSNISFKVNRYVCNYFDLPFLYLRIHADNWHLKICGVHYNNTLGRKKYSKSLIIEFQIWKGLQRLVSLIHFL